MASIPIKILRTCPHRDSCTSFRQILPVTALKILEGRQPVGGFLPYHKKVNAVAVEKYLLRLANDVKIWYNRLNRCLMCKDTA